MVGMKTDATHCRKATKLRQTGGRSGAPVYMRSFKFAGNAARFNKNETIAMAVLLSKKSAGTISEDLPYSLNK
jgi:hypothetical protein